MDGVELMRVTYYSKRVFGRRILPNEKSYRGSRVLGIFRRSPVERPRPGKTEAREWTIVAARREYT